MRQYDTYTTSPVKKTTYVIIEVENNKSLQFQINWLNIGRDRCVKAQCKIHPKILNFLTEFRPGEEPPRDARDSGSARSHSTHLETSSSDRP